MSYPNGSIQVTGSIGTTCCTDVYATHLDYLGYGGARAIDTLADMCAITPQRRQFGMTVNIFGESCCSNNGTYVLANSCTGGVDDNICNNANWIPISCSAFGGGGGGGIMILGTGCCSTIRCGVDNVASACYSAAAFGQCNNVEETYCEQQLGANLGSCFTCVTTCSGYYFYAQINNANYSSLFYCGLIEDSPIYNLCFIGDTCCFSTTFQSCCAVFDGTNTILCGDYSNSYYCSTVPLTLILQSGIHSNYSSIISGDNNKIIGNNSTILSGSYNQICNFCETDAYNLILGGIGHNSCGGVFDSSLNCFSTLPTSNTCIDGSYNTIINGYLNLIEGTSSFNTVSGYCNTLSNTYHTIVSGYCNNINYSYGSLILSSFNTICNVYSSIIATNAICYYGCAYNNSILINGAGVCFGDINSSIVNISQSSIIESSMSILNGNYNNIYSQFSIINGSQLKIGNNTSCEQNAFIGAGSYHCMLNTNYVTIENGTHNTTCCSCLSTIGNGNNNQIYQSQYSTILNGNNNVNFGNYNSINNGCNNNLCSCYSTIINGINNNSCSCYSTIINGRNNNICSCNSTIINGICQTNSGAYGFIGGGKQNLTDSNFSTILNGQCNVVCSNYSSVFNGLCNTVSGYYSTILTGVCNSITCGHGFAFGDCNTVCAPYSGAFGCNLQANIPCTYFVNNLCACNTMNVGQRTDVLSNGICPNYNYAFVNYCYNTTANKVYVASIDTNYLNYCANINLDASNVVAGAVSIDTHNFCVSGSSISVTQGGSANAIRAISAFTAQSQFRCSGCGTLTHHASIQSLGWSPDQSPTGIITVCNNFGLLINDQNGYSGSGAICLIKRWGLYQEGACDTNFMCAPLLIGTLTNSGYCTLVNGCGRYCGSLTATAFYQCSDLRGKNILCCGASFDSMNFSMVKFNYKDDKNCCVHFGYVAQEVEKYIPEVIEENNEGMKKINYIELHTIQIEMLKKEIEYLKSKLIN